MSRNLVLCLDGTNNKYASTNTNVVKLYALLDRTANDQFAYYQPGIGTYAPPGTWSKLKHWWITRLDLAIAWLLEDHVCAAYRFLMRYYEEGDQIYLFGFSRGAYTARVLAAMLYKIGLLSKGNEELVPFAWEMFTQKSSLDREPCAGFRRTFAREVRVHFLGLWDTVSSVGWAWNPSHYQYTANNPSVTTIRHALALDERRTNFVQNLWGEGHDVEEVWFPGVHSDVGGGYVESEAGLSKIALKWLLEKAESHGLKTDPRATAAILPAQDTQKNAAANALGKKHESLEGWWWIPEVLPKRIKDPANNWNPTWIWPLGRPRTVPTDALMHSSIFTRQNGLPDYRPRNIPTSHKIIP